VFEIEVKKLTSLWIMSWSCSLENGSVRGRDERDCHLRENEQHGMRLNENSIGFKNTVDYCLWMVNEIFLNHSQQTWTVYTVYSWS
jgi:hypothetical protein